MAVDNQNGIEGAFAQIGQNHLLDGGVGCRSQFLRGLGLCLLEPADPLRNSVTRILRPRRWQVDEYSIN